MKSLLDVLRQIKDPRSRQGRIYPLWGILALLTLAAMHGETSLRGMWHWGKLRAEQLVNNLGLWRYPALSTMWYSLQRLDTGVLEEGLRPWLPGEGAYAVDGKVLRGSKRPGERALEVLALVGQGLGQVLAQRQVEGGDELAAALALLEEVPLEGKVVSADAAILRAPFAQKVVEKGGGYIGLVKANQPALREALEEWVNFWSQQRGKKASHWVEVTKGHGRIEQREVWIVPCEADMQAYVRDYFGWPGVQWCGRIRRLRRTSTREEEQVHVWVAGAAFPWLLDAQTAAQLLRRHWTIENRVFHVRDVTMDEDRLNGRRIGPALSSIRNVTLSLLRHFFPVPYLPDAVRLVQAMPDDGFSLLTALPLEH